MPTIGEMRTEEVTWDVRFMSQHERAGELKKIELSLRHKSAILRAYFSQPGHADDFITLTLRPVIAKLEDELWKYTGDGAEHPLLFVEFERTSWMSDPEELCHTILRFLTNRFGSHQNSPGDIAVSREVEKWDGQAWVSEAEALEAELLAALPPSSIN